MYLSACNQDVELEPAPVPYERTTDGKTEFLQCLYMTFYFFVQPYVVSEELRLSGSQLSLCTWIFLRFATAVKVFVCLTINKHEHLYVVW
jgi:hypothetical protein